MEKEITRESLQEEYYQKILLGLVKNLKINNEKSQYIVDLDCKHILQAANELTHGAVNRQLECLRAKSKEADDLTEAVEEWNETVKHIEAELCKVVDYTGAKVGEGLTADELLEKGEDTIGDAIIRKIDAVVPDMDTLEKICGEVAATLSVVELVDDRHCFQFAKMLRGKLKENTGLNNKE